MNVGGTQLVLDRARRVGATPLRARVVELAVRREPRRATTASTRTRRSRRTWRTAARSSRPSSSCSAATTAATSRPSIVRPPWFYGPFQPERQTQFLAAVRRGPLPARRARARSGARWSTPATSCRACCSPRRVEAAPGHAYWIADAEPYELRDVLRHGARRARGRRASRVEAPARSPMPRIAGVVAEKLDALAQASGRYVQVAARARRVEGHDRVRHLAGAQGARLRADGRAVRRHAGQRALVPRTR